MIQVSRSLTTASIFKWCFVFFFFIWNLLSLCKEFRYRTSFRSTTRNVWRHFSFVLFAVKNKDGIETGLGFYQRAKWSSILELFCINSKSSLKIKIASHENRLEDNEYDSRIMANKPRRVGNADCRSRIGWFEMSFEISVTDKLSRVKGTRMFLIFSKTREFWKLVFWHLINWVNLT